MSIYLLDADTLSVDLAIIKCNSNDELINLFCNNAVYYENELPKLDMAFIQAFKDNHPDMFDAIIKLTKTRVV